MPDRTARLGSLLASRPVGEVARAAGRYDRAGGGLLAGGLAFTALFAIVPTVLLAAGASGLLIADPAVRSRVAEIIVRVMPPVRDLIGVILEEAARDAGPVSLIGGVTLVWGASRFVIAFQDAFARITGSRPSRGLIGRNAIAFASVVVGVAAVLAGTVLVGIGSFLDAAEASGVLERMSAAVDLALGILPFLLAAVALAVVYRIVPASTASWRAVSVPAAAVAVALTVLARLFVYFAPRLIGAAAILGTLTTVFVALAWLALSFQAILFGVAWVHERHAGGPAGVPAQPS